MKKIFLLLLLCFVLTGCFSPSARQDKPQNMQKCSDPNCLYEVIDDQKTVVHFQKKPERILTFSGGTDEVVLGLVKPEKMVAVSKNFFDPKSSNVFHLTKKIKHKLDRNPSIETVLKLQPDLVIVQSWISLEKLQALRDLKIPVVVCDPPQNLQSIEHLISLIAASLDENEKGKQLISRMHEELNKISAKIEKIPNEQKNKKIVIISVMPTYGGKGSTFDDICKFAHAQNAKALAGIKQGQTMNKEQLLQINPDVIFLPSYHRDASEDKILRDEYLNDASLQAINAVKNKKILFPWAHYIHNISQNIVFGVQETAYLLYGDEFKQDTTKHLTVAE